MSSKAEEARWNASVDIAATFRKFDLDGNGSIDQNELVAILHFLDPIVWTVENVKKLWAVVDTNDDGLISYDEFSDWLTKPKRPTNFDKDHVFDADDLLQVRLNFEALEASVRRGSVVLREVVPEAELQSTWEEFAHSHSYGKMAGKKEKLGTEREWSTSGKLGDTDKGPFVACQKGSKGEDDPSPNQDNFSVTYFKNGYAMACAFDGHGQDGHRVATRTVQTVPYFLVKSKFFPDNMEEALREAFLNSQSELMSYALENRWDAEASGSTAVAAVWKDRTVWLANAGDSRAVIGSRAQGSKGKILTETEDHKPESPKEKQRIEEMGGEVRSKTYPDGWVNHRIFVKGERYPGLCMSRTLGDNCAKEIGVVAEPEVTKFEIEESDVGQTFMVLSSDGVWEFMDSKTVSRTLARELHKKGPTHAVQKVQQEARKLWAKNEDCYCDDITTVLILF